MRILPGLRFCLVFLVLLAIGIETHVMTTRITSCEHSTRRGSFGAKVQFFHKDLMPPIVTLKERFQFPLKLWTRALCLA